MHRKIFACLSFVFVATCCTAMQECRAESFDPNGFDTSTEKTSIPKSNTCSSQPGTTSNNLPSASPMMPMPVMPGATNGTVGPPSSSYGDAFSSQATYDEELIAPLQEPPVILLILLGSFAVGIVVVGIRSIFLKKRAPLWSFGLIVAGALMIIGFLVSYYQSATPRRLDALSHEAQTPMSMVAQTSQPKLPMSKAPRRVQSIPMSIVPWTGGQPTNTTADAGAAHCLSVKNPADRSTHSTAGTSAPAATTFTD